MPIALSIGSTLLTATACHTPLDSFAPASEPASRIAALTWFMIITSGVIAAGVVATMMVAIVRNRRRDPGGVNLEERGIGWLLWGGTVLPVVVLSAVSIVAVRVMRQRDTRLPAAVIRVTGHQWWWQLDYRLPETGVQFRAANELHIPLGRPVRLLLTTSDVIHSFWIPRLAGKMDLIPGDTNGLNIEARSAGTFGGACAEYCGAQHAHMAITVVAQDSSAFNAWAAAQASDAALPVDSTAALGARLFASGPCAGCHTVRGTSARAEIGPDLTHVGSRATLAAGTLLNSLGGVEGWIANPQAIKPGAMMPTLGVYSGPELRALAAYLVSLK